MGTAGDNRHMGRDGAGSGNGVVFPKDKRKCYDFIHRFCIGRDDEKWIVEVPELPGCMADGETPQEALSNVEVIINEWIETAREIGRDIPEHHGRLLYA